jgi:hypothetical protein
VAQANATPWLFVGPSRLERAISHEIQQIADSIANPIILDRFVSEEVGEDELEILAFLSSLFN